MTILRDISLVYTSFFSLIVLLMLFESRFPSKKFLRLTLFTMVPLLAVNCVLLFVLGPQKMSTLLLLTCSLPSLVFFWFVAKHRDGRFFFTFCLADTLVLEIIHITSVLDFFLGNQYIFMFAARLLLCPLLALVAFKWVRPLYLQLQDSVPKGWSVFAVIALIFYVVLSMSFSVPTMITQRLEQLPAFVLLLILMPAIYIQIFRTLYSLQSLHEMKEQDNILRLQVANLTERMEEISAADEKFRTERHDFRHKLQVISAMADQGDCAGIRKAVQVYEDHIQETVVIRYCQSAAIDAVLSAYLQKAERRHIRIGLALDFPEIIPADEMELATVFANALENAIHAAEKLPEGRRMIEVKVLSQPRFMLQISNTYDQPITFDENRIPLAAEQDHGFGTRSIVAFCEKNKAFFEFKAEESTFKLRISF